MSEPLYGTCFICGYAYPQPWPSGHACRSPLVLAESTNQSTPREALRARCRELFRIQPDAQLGRGGIVVYFCDQIIATCVDQHWAEKHVDKMMPSVEKLIAAERAEEAEEILARMNAQGMMDYPPCRSDDTITEFVNWCEARAAAWREKGDV